MHPDVCGDVADLHSLIVLHTFAHHTRRGEGRQQYLGQGKSHRQGLFQRPRRETYLWFSCPYLVCYVCDFDRVLDRALDHCNWSRGPGLGAGDVAYAGLKSCRCLKLSLHRYCDRTPDPRSERVRAASDFEWAEVVRLGDHSVVAVGVRSTVRVVVFVDTARLVPVVPLRGTAAVEGMSELDVVWIVEGIVSRTAGACLCRSKHCNLVVGTDLVAVSGIEVVVVVVVAGIG